MGMENIYTTKIRPIPGFNTLNIQRQARDIYKKLARKTKRRPYIRSAYFHKEKIFLDYFWDHIYSKNWGDRMRRLKQYPCALDLIMHSRIKPISKDNPNKSSEILHRFSGINADNAIFFVQIKEDRKNGQKCLISIFPGS